MRIQLASSLTVNNQRGNSARRTRGAQFTVLPTCNTTVDPNLVDTATLRALFSSCMVYCIRGSSLGPTDSHAAVDVYLTQGGRRELTNLNRHHILLGLISGFSTSII
jgi:hypothetical protein